MRDISNRGHSLLPASQRCTPKLAGLVPFPLLDGRIMWSGSPDLRRTWLLIIPCLLPEQTADQTGSPTCSDAGSPAWGMAGRAQLPSLLNSVVCMPISMPSFPRISLRKTTAGALSRGLSSMPCSRQASARSSPRPGFFSYHTVGHP